MRLKMNRLVSTFAAAASCVAAYGVSPSTSPDRVKVPLRVDLERIGTLAPRMAAEVGDSMWTIAHGLDPMLETGYGNPLYPNGGSAALMGSSFPSGEALDAWDRWVEALVLHFKDRVRDYEMWNESNNVKANTPKLIAERSAIRMM